MQRGPHGSTGPGAAQLGGYRVICKCDPTAVKLNGVHGKLIDKIRGSSLSTADLVKQGGVPVLNVLNDLRMAGKVAQDRQGFWRVQE